MKQSYPQQTGKFFVYWKCESSSIAYLLSTNIKLFPRNSKKCICPLKALLFDFRSFNNALLSKLHNIFHWYSSIFLDESCNNQTDGQVFLNRGETVIVIGNSQRRGYLVVEKHNHTMHVPHYYMELKRLWFWFINVLCHLFKENIYFSSHIWTFLFLFHFKNSPNLIEP